MKKLTYKTLAVAVLLAVGGIGFTTGNYYGTSSSRDRTNQEWQERINETLFQTKKGYSNRMSVLEDQLSSDKIDNSLSPEDRREKIVEFRSNMNKLFGVSEFENRLNGFSSEKEILDYIEKLTGKR